MKELCEIQVKIGVNVSYIRNFFYLCIDKETSYEKQAKSHISGRCSGFY